MQDIDDSEKCCNFPNSVCIKTPQLVSKNHN